LGFGFRVQIFVVGVGVAHSWLGGVVEAVGVGHRHVRARDLREREFFSDDLLVRIHFIIVMISISGIGTSAPDTCSSGFRVQGSGFRVQGISNLAVGHRHVRARHLPFQASDSGSRISF